MAEVPDHLVPEDGHTNSAIRFDEMKVLHGTGTAAFKFAIYDEDQNWIGNFEIVVANPPRGGVSAMIAEAHRGMTEVLRTWLYWTDEMRQIYESQIPAQSQEPQSR
jgi:hypothetical protein